MRFQLPRSGSVQLPLRVPTKEGRPSGTMLSRRSAVAPGAVFSISGVSLPTRDPSNEMRDPNFSDHLKSESQEEGTVMDRLTRAERELVALGAALGSNCVPCIEYHIPEARKAGLSDRQISEAIQLADKVRQVPARKVLGAALGMLPAAKAGTDTEQSSPGCGKPVQDGEIKQPCCG